MLTKDMSEGQGMRVRFTKVATAILTAAVIAFIGVALAVAALVTLDSYSRMPSVCVDLSPQDCRIMLQESYPK